MKRRPKIRLQSLAIGSSLVVTLLSLTTASASSANISHSYQASGSLVPGNLVSLDSSRSNYVQAANSSNGSRLLGIVVAKNDSLLAVDESNDTVQVATSGTASTLVSTLNGNIAVGDQISASPFNGVGSKTLPGAPIIGLAQTSFSSKTAGAQPQTVTDRTGHHKQVYVGYLRLSIGVGTAASAANANSQLNGLQRIVKSLTGHVVSTARIVIALVIVLVAFVALITLVYGSIYGSIISIGRNPLAKYAVLRSLSMVFGMALMLALVAGLMVFFLLR